MARQAGFTSFLWDFLHILAVFTAHTPYSIWAVVSVDVERWRARIYTSWKTRRERRWPFPLPLLEKAYEIRVEHGQASREEDRVRILNSIAEEPLESEPDLQHPAYADVTCIKFEQRS